MYNRVHILTSQENLILGGTPLDGDPYTPEDLLTGEASLDEVRKLREEKGVYRDPGVINMFRGKLGVPADHTIELRLQPLDPDGKTEADPEIVAGTVDKETGELKDPRDISTEVFDLVESFNNHDLHRRELEGVGSHPEGNRGGGESLV